MVRIWPILVNVSGEFEKNEYSSIDRSRLL